MTVFQERGVPASFWAAWWISRGRRNSCRPDQAAEVHLSRAGQPRQVAVANRTPERWFNTAAFSAPAAYTIGNSPRRLNELRASQQKNADVSVAKNFSVRERIKIQFRAEAFNLTNTPQFSWPDTAFGSTTFGVVSGTMNVGPRNVQLGLKVDF